MSVRQLLLFCSESLETCLPDTADSVDIFIWKTDLRYETDIHEPKCFE